MTDSSHIAVRHSVNEFRSASYRSGDAFIAGAVNINSSNLIGSSGGGGGAASAGGIGGGVIGGISGANVTGAMPSSSSTTSTNNEIPHSPTPPLQRRLAKSFSVAPSNTQSKGAYDFFFLFFLVNIYHFSHWHYFNTCTKSK